MRLFMLTNNDFFRMIRYALKINDKSLIQIFKNTEYELTEAEITGLLTKEGEDGFLICTNILLNRFLDGLIIYKRGKKKDSENEPYTDNPVLTNNIVLQKLRIALELKDVDMIEIFKLAGVELSKPELSAFFRQKGNKNFKMCGDQYLRNFIKGLTTMNRKE
jgi:uncharacterized protein YehS (DUF1456 family)